MTTSNLGLFAVFAICLAAPAILAQETADGGGSGSSPSGTKSESFSHWTTTPSGGLAGQASTRTENAWILVDGFYTPYKHMSGGGGSFAGEWIHPDANVGVGGRIGVTFLSGHEGDYKIKNDTLDLDAFIPIRLSDWLIAYAGVGVQFFDMEYSYTVPGNFRYQDGRGGYYSRNGKTITFVCDKPSTISTLYVGLRVPLSEYLFVFGEYHRDAGTITMECDDSSVRHYMDSIDVDLDASRYVIGAGILF